MENENSRISRTVSLYPEELAIVHQYAKDRGQTFSSGLRLIIREWMDLKTLYQEELPTASKLQT